MVLVEAISLAYTHPESPEELFSGLSFSIHSRSRVGLVGENGAGKTTLLELVRGGIEPQGGRIVRASSIKTGYLPQVPSAASRASPGGGFECRLRKDAAALGLDPEFIVRQPEELRGGEKTTLVLARLFSDEPYLFLLDEPTNHLDEAGREAVERFIAGGRVPYLVVSHDRRFLDETVDEIWELAGGRITVYAGGYSAYRTAKELQHSKKLASYERTKAEIERLAEAAREKKSAAFRMEKFKAKRSVKRNGGLCQRDAGAGKGRLRLGNAMRGATALEGRIAKLAASEDAKRPEDLLRRRIRVDAGGDGNRRVLSVQDLTAGYDGGPVFSGLSFDLFRGERLALRGRNGSGKTTLFRVIRGDLPAAEGRVLVPPSVRAAFIGQELENLDPGTTLLDTVMGCEFGRQTKARLVLADFGLTGDSVFRRIREASVGERTKTALARVIFVEPDLFLLDEPTNHLEPESLEALERAFLDFPGGVVFASHDRTFVERTATRTIDMERFLHHGEHENRFASKQ